MDVYLWIYGGVGALFAGLFLAVYLDGRRAKAVGGIFRRVATNLGLEATEDPPQIHGRIDGFTLDVDQTSLRDSDLAVGRGSGVLIRVDARGRMPEWMTLSREPALSGVAKVFTGDDVRVGDPEFDRRVKVSGAEAEVVAALSAEARTRVIAFVEAGGEIRRGGLELYLATDKPDEESIRSALAVARALAVPSVPAALRANAATDPIPEVRKRNLELVLRLNPDSEDARGAREAGMDDPAPEVRLVAASGLSSARAREVLSRLVADAEVGEQAVERLAADHPWDTVFEVLLKVASFASSGAARRAAIRALGAAREASALDPLIHLAEAADDATAAAIAEALGNLGGERAEQALVALLGHPSAATRRAAMQALGKCGTIRAVEPLLPHTRGPAADAALAAVRSIQARLGDVAAGRLSVVGGEQDAGALSVLPDGRAKLKT